jgi:hypothetical protein
MNRFWCPVLPTYQVTGDDFGLFGPEFGHGSEECRESGFS